MTSFEVMDYETLSSTIYFSMFDVTGGLKQEIYRQVPPRGRFHLVPKSAYDYNNEQYLVVDEDIGNMEIIWISHSESRIADNKSADISGTLVFADGEVLLQGFISENSEDEWDPQIIYSDYLKSYLVFYTNLGADGFGWWDDIYVRRVRYYGGKLETGPELKLISGKEIVLFSKPELNKNGDKVFLIWHNSTLNAEHGPGAIGLWLDLNDL